MSEKVTRDQELEQKQPHDTKEVPSADAQNMSPIKIEMQMTVIGGRPSKTAEAEQEQEQEQEQANMPQQEEKMSLIELFIEALIKLCEAIVKLLNPLANNEQEQKGPQQEEEYKGPQLR